jgi:hypothetical protein
MLLNLLQLVKVPSEHDQGKDWDSDSPSEESRQRNKEENPKVGASEAFFFQIIVKSVNSFDLHTIDRLRHLLDDGWIE